MSALRTSSAKLPQIMRHPCICFDASDVLLCSKRSLLLVLIFGRRFSQKLLCFLSSGWSRFLITQKQERPGFMRRLQQDLYCMTYTYTFVNCNCLQYIVPSLTSTLLSECCTNNMTLQQTVRFRRCGLVLTCTETSFRGKVESSPTESRKFKRTTCWKTHVVPSISSSMQDQNPATPSCFSITITAFSTHHQARDVA